VTAGAHFPVSIISVYSVRVASPLQGPGKNALIHTVFCRAEKGYCHSSVGRDIARLLPD
jgi:hypothetical protein